MEPFIVGICGGSGSGKNYFIEQLVQQLPKEEVCQVSQDNYYKEISKVPLDENGIQNFDLPEAIDFDKFIEHLYKLKKGESVEIKEYTFNNPSKNSRHILLNSAPVLLVEGFLIFANDALKELFDVKIFITAPDVVKIKRRIQRDELERGYDMKDVLYRYEHHVHPSYQKYISPHIDSVDLIIPNDKDITKVTPILSTYLNKIISLR